MSPPLSKCRSLLAENAHEVVVVGGYLSRGSGEPSQFTYNNDGWFGRAIHPPGRLRLCHLQELIDGTEIKSFRRAGYGAGRLNIRPDAEIAHLHDAVVIKLGHTVRTCRKTVPTTVAFVPVNDDDTILNPFAYSSGGTRFNAGRLAAVHTGQREEGPGDGWVGAMPNVNDSPPLDSRPYTTHAPARHLTGAALDTPICVKVKAVLLCHHVYCLFVHYDR